MNAADLQEKHDRVERCEAAQRAAELAQAAARTDVASAESRFDETGLPADRDALQALVLTHERADRLRLRSIDEAAAARAALAAAERVVVLERFEALKTEALDSRRKLVAAMPELFQLEYAVYERILRFVRMVESEHHIYQEALVLAAALGIAERFRVECQPPTIEMCRTMATVGLALELEAKDRPPIHTWLEPSSRPPLGAPSAEWRAIASLFEGK